MNTQKMIMIPEWRYYKMIESYDNALKELEKTKKALEEAATSPKAEKPGHLHNSRICLDYTVYPAENQGGFKKMHNESLASEIIKSMVDEKHAVMTELEILDTDFDKAAFVLNGVQETMESIQEPKTLDDGLVQYSNIQSSLVYLSVVFDYIKNIQTAIYDIVVRERKKDKEIREERENEL